MASKLVIFLIMFFFTSHSHLLIYQKHDSSALMLIPIITVDFSSGSINYASLHNCSSLVELLIVVSIMT